MVERVERAKMAVFLCAILTKIVFVRAEPLTSAVHNSTGVKLRKIMQVCKL